MSVTTQVDQAVLDTLQQAYPTKTADTIAEMAINRLWADIVGVLDAPEGDPPTS